MTIVVLFSHSALAQQLGWSLHASVGAFVSDAKAMSR
jgi:hypothetical protein